MLQHPTNHALVGRGKLAAPAPDSRRSPSPRPQAKPSAPQPTAPVRDGLDAVPDAQPDGGSPA